MQSSVVPLFAIGASVGARCVVGALGLMLFVGCGNDGSGASAGIGGVAGVGGATGSGGAAGVGSMPECAGAKDCDDANDCTSETCDDGMCRSTPVADGTTCDESNECGTGICTSGTCNSTPVADDTMCGDGLGSCLQGSCRVACSEEGIRGAIAAGGGPYSFDCGAPTTIVTESEIVIDNNVILDGEGQLTVDGAETHRLFSVAEDVTVELHGWTITNGRSQAESEEVRNDGGGIANYGSLLLRDSVITANEGAGGGICSRVPCYNAGGGIFNSGNLTVLNTVVSENGAFAAGGIRNEGAMTLSESIVSDNSGAFGSSAVSSAGELTVMNSTVSGNIAAGLSTSGHLEVTNSTVSENTGPGISVRIGTASLTHTTISGSSPEEGAIRFYADATIEMTATLVVGPCVAIGVNLAVMSNSYNIESPGDTCGLDHDTDRVDTSAVELDLGLLASNGGPTQTHAITTDSPAFNKIPAEDCEVDTDQRGVERPQGEACDIGAFELEQ